MLILPSQMKKAGYSMKPLVMLKGAQKYSERPWTELKQLLSRYLESHPKNKNHQTQNVEMTGLISTSGILTYYVSWAVVYLDIELGRYYRSLCPKAWNLQAPLYPPHVTIVRKDVEKPTGNWRYKADQKINLAYIPQVKTDGIYFWLDCFSPELEDIREKLGLPRQRIGYSNFHITIGNTKGQ